MLGRCTDGWLDGGFKTTHVDISPAFPVTVEFGTFWRFLSGTLGLQVMPTLLNVNRGPRAKPELKRGVPDIPTHPRSTALLKSCWAPSSNTIFTQWGLQHCATAWYSPIKSADNRRFNGHTSAPGGSHNCELGRVVAVTARFLPHLRGCSVNAIIQQQNVYFEVQQDTAVVYSCTSAHQVVSPDLYNFSGAPRSAGRPARAGTASCGEGGINNNYNYKYSTSMERVGWHHQQQQ